MRPLGNPIDKAVLDRIYMNIGDMVSKISLVAHGMLPIAVLPKPVFATCIRLQIKTGCEEIASETRFYLPKPVAECGIVSGSVISTCRWSGRMTIALIVNGALAFVVRNAWRKAVMWSTSSVARRSASVSVKKYVPPGMYRRRYRTIGEATESELFALLCISSACDTMPCRWSEGRSG